MNNIMRKIGILIILIITLCSCQSLRLSNLTNDIIDMYISQSPNEEIENICIVITDNEEVLMFDIVNYPRGMRHCNDTAYYWGDIRQDTYRVAVYGTLNKLFVTARYITPQKNPCNWYDLWFWEPTEWGISINKKDQTVSVYKVNSFIDEKDINTDDLKMLVESYLKK